MAIIYEPMVVRNPEKEARTFRLCMEDLSLMVRCNMFHGKDRSHNNGRMRQQECFFLFFVCMEKYRVEGVTDRTYFEPTF